MASYFRALYAGAALGSRLGLLSAGSLLLVVGPLLAFLVWLVYVVGGALLAARVGLPQAQVISLPERRQATLRRAA